MDKFEHLEKEFSSLKKHILNCSEQIAKNLSMLSSLSTLGKQRAGIFNGISAGIMTTVPHILANRIDFNDSLVRTVIGLREILEVSNGEFKKISEIELSDYVSESYITVGHLAAMQVAKELFSVEANLVWMQNAFLSVATELDCLKI